jgi:hypothetical protein
MDLENPTSLSTIKASHYFGRLREFGQLCMFVLICKHVTITICKPALYTQCGVNIPEML